MPGTQKWTDKENNRNIYYRKQRRADKCVLNAI